MTTITIDRATVEQALEALAPWMDSDHTVQHAAYHALRTALAQQAEPVEPAAWGVDWGRDGDRSCVSITKKRADGTVEVVAVEYGPLYTAPPKLVPLTEEEIVRIRMSLPHFVPSPDQHPYEWAVRYTRAVERALEEKNRGR